jgi:hypothetical protein
MHRNGRFADAAMHSCEITRALIDGRCFDDQNAKWRGASRASMELHTPH